MTTILSFISLAATNTFKNEAIISMATNVICFIHLTCSIPHTQNLINFNTNLGSTWVFVKVRKGRMENGSEKG